MSIWEWLADEANQRTLGFIGGVIAALAGAGWAIFTYFHQGRRDEDKISGGGEMRDPSEAPKHNSLIQIASFSDIQKYDPQLRDLDKLACRHTTVSVDSCFPRPEPGKPTAILIGIAGSMQGCEAAVEKEDFRIGADRDNDLVIENDEYVSNHHAQLVYDEGSLYLADLQSRNETFVNDMKLSDAAVRISPGDCIQVGVSIFEVKLHTQQEL